MHIGCIPSPVSQLDVGSLCVSDDTISVDADCDLIFDLDKTKEPVDGTCEGNEFIYMYDMII